MSKITRSNAEADQPLIYEIRIGGRLSSQWMEWFDGLSIVVEVSGETSIVGEVADQAALFGLLKKVRDLGMPLLAVNVIQSQPNKPLALRGPRKMTKARLLRTERSQRRIRINKE
jgi:hypothetical protein